MLAEGVFYFMTMYGIMHIGAQFMGPYPTLAVCEAARTGAADFGGPVTGCMPPLALDEYMYNRIEHERRMDEMDGAGRDT